MALCALFHFSFVAAKPGVVRYSHGFLFPSEADRVRQGIRAFFDRQPVPPTDQTATAPNRYDKDWNAPAEWSRSTVSTFGTRYLLPLPNLTTAQSIEALVEGSDMSGLYEGASSTWLTHVSAHAFIQGVFGPRKMHGSYARVAKIGTMVSGWAAQLSCTSSRSTCGSSKLCSLFWKVRRRRSTRYSDGSVKSCRGKDELLDILLPTSNNGQVTCDTDRVC